MGIFLAMDALTIRALYAQRNNAASLLGQGGAGCVVASPDGASAVKFYDQTRSSARVEGKILRSLSHGPRYFHNDSGFPGEKNPIRRN